MIKELNNEEFNMFLRTISTLKDTCTDAEIINGVVRQRTNSYSCLFEVDLTSIIDNINLPIVCIKQKLDILKMFNKSEKINIYVDDKSYSFSDDYSLIRFCNPNPKFIDNKFIDDNSYSSMVQFDQNNLIMDCTLSKIITDRIKIISQAFNIDVVQIKFNGDNASILSVSQSKDQEAKFLDNIKIHKNLNTRINIMIVPIKVDHDGDIKLKIYDTNNDSCICLFETELVKSSINIYSNIITQTPFVSINDLY